jgi:hypothetical protein
MYVPSGRNPILYKCKITFNFLNEKIKEKMGGKGKLKGSEMG